MGIANGASTLQRVAFEINGKFYNFRVNPQNITEKYPNRVSVMKTQETYYTQGFGMGVHTIEISGNTGWGGGGYARATLGASTVHPGAGVVKIKELRKALSDYELANTYGDAGTFVYHDFTNGYSWNVTLGPEGFTLNQSVDSPIMFNYSINMIVLSAASQPSAREITAASLGNTRSTMPLLPVYKNWNTTYRNPVQVIRASTNYQKPNPKPKTKVKVAYSGVLQNPKAKSSVRVGLNAMKSIMGVRTK